MSTSELAIQQGLQAALQAMPEFEDVDVVINDWAVLDQPNSAAPYVIITNADDFDARMDTAATQTTWNVVVELCEKFTDWRETLDHFRTRRQAIIDRINTGTVRSAGDGAQAGINGLTIDRVFSGGPIVPYYDPYLSDEQLREALPVFLRQTIVLVCSEF